MHMQIVRSQWHDVESCACGGGLTTLCVVVV